MAKEVRKTIGGKQDLRTKREKAKRDAADKGHWKSTGETNKGGKEYGKTRISKKWWRCSCTSKS